eukprot:m.216444 g.216444  ORF g.216444 m.216444 type:complete len:99 (-) comp13805_c0_seq1:2762-3058(-)
MFSFLRLIQFVYDLVSITLCLNNVGNMCGSSRDCSSSNCDQCGGFNSQISHRAMLYWEIQDDGYPANQWFHATPMNLDRSTGPDNSVQDIEFYLREKK